MSFSPQAQDALQAYNLALQACPARPSCLKDLEFLILAIEKYVEFAHCLLDEVLSTTSPDDSTEFSFDSFIIEPSVIHWSLVKSPKRTRSRKGVEGEGEEVVREMPISEALTYAYEPDLSSRDDPGEEDPKSWEQAILRLEPKTLHEAIVALEDSLSMGEVILGALLSSKILVVQNPNHFYQPKNAYLQYETRD